MPSIMAPNAIGHIATKSESPKIVGIENLRVHTLETGRDRFLQDLISLILGLRAPKFAHRRQQV